MKIDLIYGPPGTGKTTKLLSILEKELNQVDPDQIAYVSFTRKGSYEGRDRAMKKFRFSESDLPYFKTLHSIAFKQMGVGRDDMISKDHYKQFSKAMGMKFSGYYTEDLTHDDDMYLFFNMLYRNNPAIAEKMLDKMHPKMITFVSNNYKRFKKTLDIFDYTDLLEMYFKEGVELPVKVAIIDEAQDITSLQWKVIWKAFRSCERVYIAGDDDQAIYEWSGADVSYFLGLKGKQTLLSKSWRLPKLVHDYSTKITDLIGTRIDKQYTHNGQQGHLELLNSYTELNIDNQSSWLFLSRNIWHMNKVEEWLRSKSLVYEKKGKKSINNDIIKAINNHFKVSNGGRISDSAKLSLSFYMESLEDKFVKPWYDEFTKLKPETIKYYRDVIGNKTETEDCNIQINTIHGSKGGEADNVVLLLEHNSRINQNVEDNFDSEMRCYYVGVTRTKKNLYLVLPEGQFGYKYLG